MSPSKENVKIRAQRPGSRLQELEQELAKIHHRGSIFATAPIQPLTPPISVQTQQPVQNLLTTTQPVSTVPVATVTPNIVTSRSGTNTPIQAEFQDTTNEVIFCNIFDNIFIFVLFIFLFSYVLHLLVGCYTFCFLKHRHAQN